MSTIRARAFLALAACALVTTLLTVGVASLLLERQRDDRRAAALQRIADVVAPTLAERLPGGGPDTVRVVRLAALATRRGARPVRGPLRRRVLASVPVRDGATGVADVGERRFSYAVRRTAVGTVVLIGPPGDRAATGPPPTRTVLLAGSGGLLVALLLAALLARRTTAPLRAMTERARALARGEGTDLPVPEAGPAELRELGRSFNAMTRELDAAHADRAGFLRSVGHELRTPLTAIRGYGEAIADGTVEPARAATVIGEEAARLERLVGDLMDLGRGFTCRREPIDLAAVAREAGRRHAVAATGLGVTLTVDARGPAPAAGDHDRAVQAVSNLVENALRVAPVGGRIEIAALPGTVEVRDDGPGLAQQDLARAFERFYLHDRLRSDRPVGSGLGLAIVAELATAMGGTVQVRSDPGVRTTFTLRLPATPGPPPAASRAERDAAGR
ncbi:sensor histidine kinase [Paraconexibacter algicola]|uniref:histidine kinase n=1 Tax=Paraconexibacter algicola TaxID=2133960 RepID=A0A2T4UKF7_9ACTN|nr:HAMP domain-containing sensor histidine kinase [Paraconexibacter algicola]PTL59736.1 hypothetical protein C7Y72_08755 [Paraconexibacter algicola]